MILSSNVLKTSFHFLVELTPILEIINKMRPIVTEILRKQLFEYFEVNLLINNEKKITFAIFQTALTFNKEIGLSKAII